MYANIAIKIPDQKNTVKVIVKEVKQQSWKRFGKKMKYIFLFWLYNGVIMKLISVLK